MLWDSDSGSDDEPKPIQLMNRPEQPLGTLLRTSTLATQTRTGAPNAIPASVGEITQNPMEIKFTPTGLPPSLFQAPAEAVPAPKSQQMGLKSLTAETVKPTSIWGKTDKVDRLPDILPPEPDDKIDMFVPALKEPEPEPPDSNSNSNSNSMGSIPDPLTSRHIGRWGSADGMNSSGSVTIPEPLNSLGPPIPVSGIDNPLIPVGEGIAESMGLVAPILPNPHFPAIMEEEPVLDEEERIEKIQQDLGIPVLRTKIMRQMSTPGTDEVLSIMHAKGLSSSEAEFQQIPQMDGLDEIPQVPISGRSARQQRMSCVTLNNSKYKIQGRDERDDADSDQAERRPVNAYRELDYDQQSEKSFLTPPQNMSSPQREQPKSLIAGPEPINPPEEKDQLQPNHQKSQLSYQERPSDQQLERVRPLSPRQEVPQVNQRPECVRSSPIQQPEYAKPQQPEYVRPVPSQSQDYAQPPVTQPQGYTRPSPIQLQEYARPSVNRQQDYVQSPLNERQAYGQQPQNAGYYPAQNMRPGADQQRTSQGYYPQQPANKDYYTQQTRDQGYYTQRSGEQGYYRQGTSNQGYYQRQTDQRYYQQQPANQDYYQRRAPDQGYYRQPSPTQEYYLRRTTDQGYYPQQPPTKECYPPQQERPERRLHHQLSSSQDFFRKQQQDCSTPPYQQGCLTPDQQSHYTGQYQVYSTPPAQHIRSPTGTHQQNPTRLSYDGEGTEDSGQVVSLPASLIGEKDMQIVRSNERFTTDMRIPLDRSLPETVSESSFSESERSFSYYPGLPQSKREKPKRAAVPPQAVVGYETTPSAITKDENKRITPVIPPPEAKTAMVAPPAEVNPTVVTAPPEVKPTVVMPVVPPVVSPADPPVSQPLRVSLSGPTIAPLERAEIRRKTSMEGSEIAPPPASEPKKTPAVSRELTKPQLEAKKLMELDKNVEELLIVKKSLSVFPWGAPIFLGKKMEVNPYLDPIAVKCSMQNVVANDPVVKLFSEDCCFIEMQQPNEPPVEEASMDRVLMFKSEATDIFPPVSEKIRLKLLSSFFFQQPKPAEPIKMNSKPITPLPERRFLTLQLQRFDLLSGWERVEPILCTGFLIRDQEVISEPWYFCSIENLVFTSNYLRIDPNTKASIELPNNLDDVQFVITMNRPLTVNAGAAVNKYYLKASTANKMGAIENMTNWFRLKDVWVTFAWTYCNVKDMTAKNEPFTFPKPYLTSHTVTARNVMKMLKDGDLGQQLPFNICMNVSLGSALHASDIMDSDVVLNSTIPWPSFPRLVFENRLLVTLDYANLQRLPSNMKARNIVVELALECNGKKMHAIQGQFSKDKVEKVTSHCCYHERRPCFEELYVLALPYPLESGLTLTMRVSHAVAQLDKTAKKEQAKKTPLLLIGVASLQLVKSEMLVADGQYQVPLKIDGKDAPTDAANAVAISLRTCSSFYSTDPLLESFRAVISADTLSKCDPHVATVNLFSLIDKLVMAIPDQGGEALKCLCVLSLMVQDNIDFRGFSLDFAKHFVFRNDSTITAQFHKSLLSNWGFLIGTMDPEKDRKDRLLIEFLFMLIIKSLYLTNDKDFAEDFCTFVYNWSIHISKSPISRAMGDVVLYAQFLNMMFDIRLYSCAVQGIATQVEAMADTANGHTVLISFLEQVLRPKLFYASVVSLDRMTRMILRLIAKTREQRESPTLENIFLVLMRLFQQFTPVMSQRIVARLIPVLDVLSPLESVHYATRMELHPLLTFFSFVLTTVTEAPFAAWWKRGRKPQFFASIHFLLDRIKNNGVDRIKEIVYAVHFGIWNVLQHIINQGDDEGIIGATNVIYHFLWCDIPIDFFGYLTKLFLQIIQSHFRLVLENSSPVITKHLIKVFQQSRLSRSMSDFVKKLFEVDLQHHGSIRRSMAVCCRALSYLSTAEIKRIQMDASLPIAPVIATMVEVENVMINPQLSQELRSEKIMLKAITLLPSPDAAISVLSKLITFHQTGEYWAEEMQTLLLQAAIVIEYMTRQGRLDISVFHVDRPSSVLWDLCPTARILDCKDDMCFQIQSYCDSELFSEQSLVNHMEHIINRCCETGQLEMGYLLIDTLWPFFEARRMFHGKLKDFFTKEQQIMAEIGQMSSENDRLFGKYYRICFYGSVFEIDDGQQYIYREKKLTHLFTLSDRLLEEFTRNNPGSKIELIKEAGEVDRSTLDRETGYIQITFVEPYFSKNELHERMTQYERSHLLKTFFFDTPFTKDSDKQQGAIDKQWIRRTLLTIDEPMPSILKRRRISSKTEKEYMPIRVSYRQLRDRINSMQRAVEQVDYRQIQQLLHGSLLVQVNDGPSKMAEVFLCENAEKSKYTEKMKQAFREFVKINGDGLAMHAHWVTENTAFMPLQHELESGFTELCDRLSHYI